MEDEWWSFLEDERSSLLEIECPSLLEDAECLLESRLDELFEEFLCLELCSSLLLLILELVSLDEGLSRPRDLSSLNFLSRDFDLDLLLLR